MSASIDTTSAPPAGSQLFTRKATGLVRNMSGPQQVIWNWIAAAPPLGLAFGIFAGLSGFPGGNLYVGILLTVPMALAICYTFGLLTSAMPRSGGDYTLVSRILHPAVGLAGSFCMVLAQALSIALIGGILFTSLGVASSLATVGTISGNTTLLNWAGSVATQHGWQFAVGAVLMILSGVITATGWRITKRLMFGLLAFSLFGLFVCVVVALFTPKSTFITHFNHYAQGVTAKPDTYHDTLKTAQSAGVDPSPPFSLSNSWPLVGIFGSFGIYAFITSYIGGELREGSSIKVAHRMAGAAILGLGSIALSILILFHSWGSDFVTAGFGGGLPQELGLPSYFVLTSAQIDNTAMAVFLCLSFLAFSPVLVSYLLIMISRILFAWSFDGVLPSGVTRVSKHNAPVVAIVIATLMSLGLYAWVVFGGVNVIEVVAITALLQLVPIGLVGIAAIGMPSMRPELYRASASTLKLGGIPIQVITGIGTVISVFVFGYLYLHFSYFGLTNSSDFFLWAGITLAVGVSWFFAARAVRQREGMNLDLVYREIPPE